MPEGRPASARLALLVPDGIGVRNFVLGPFLREAGRRWAVDVLHDIPEPVRQCLRDTLPAGPVQWHALRPGGDDRLQEFLRKALGYAHMAWVRTGLMNLRLRQPIEATRWRRRAFTSTARLVGRAAASRSGMRILDHLHCAAARRAPGVEHYRRLFEELQPSVL